MEKVQKVPTRIEALIFRSKSFLLQIRRLVDDVVLKRPDALVFGSALASFPVIAESITPLWTETEPEERFLVAGKIQNLRLAAKQLNGLEIEAGKTFSFWKHVGRTSRFKGYVEGRELREGCLIPSVGGGLCQISNALYDSALKANFEIIERHAHSRVISGSLAEQGRDATVFWNYVDLRFRSENAFRIEAALTEKELIVRFRGVRADLPKLHRISRATLHNDSPQSCATCGVGDCHRVVEPADHANFGSSAFLVDEYYPEFSKYILGARNGKDTLFRPINGKRFKKPNYAWDADGFGLVKQSNWVTAVRSYNSRNLAVQGKARQSNLLDMYKRLAESYARRLDHETLHITVQQDLLTFLWQGGYLGGRTFDVLMTALPMIEIQRRLDIAHKLHPESRTLADFRADQALLDAEDEALVHARTVITPHSLIAEHFKTRAVRLDWSIPERAERKKNTVNEKPVICFPATTVGRKGCYELRDALAGIDVRLKLPGSFVEDKNFWEGFDIDPKLDGWLDTADLVVLPAHIEHKPRRLLAAAAHGIPVIASSACGVDGVSGIRTVKAGDVEELRTAILGVLNI